MTVVDAPDEVFSTLLSFYCPLTAEVHPDQECRYAQTLAWVKRFDLGAGDDHRGAMLAATGAAWIAHVHPHATGDLAQAMSDYITWAWFASDVLVSGRPTSDVLVRLGRWECIIRCPDSWPDTTDPADRAVRDAVLRLRRLMTVAQMERFTASHGAWLYRVGWEASLFERGVELSVNDYVPVRLGASGADVVEAFIDPAEGMELDQHQRERPIVRAARDACMLCAAIDNDRYSSLRESHEAIKKNSVLAAVRVDHAGYSAGQAVMEAVAIRDRVMNLYLALRQQILADAGTDLRRYVTALDRLLSGNINFGMATARYLLSDSPYTMARIEQPSTSSVAPLSYPTIAWWWDQLTA